MFKSFCRKISIVLIVLQLASLLFGCKNNNTIYESNNLNYLYDEIIEEIDKEPREAFGMYGIPTGGEIVYVNYRIMDVTGDGIDELLIFRRYIDKKGTIKLPRAVDLRSFFDFMIYRSFIDEAYTIVNGNVQVLKIGAYYEVNSSVYEGVTFNQYYFLLKNGKILQSISGYLITSIDIYNNLELEDSLVYVRDDYQDIWHWELNSEKISNSEALKFLNDLM